MVELLRNWFLFILVLGGLIFFHELGHYLAAIRLGIHVKEFGLGFPPRLLKLWEWRGTVFTLNAIPFGGFVRPIGEDNPQIEGGLAAAPKRHRIVVLAAGSTMNFLVAYVALVIALSSGWPEPTNEVVIIDVVAGTPAGQVGLQPDDIILSANGERVVSTTQLADITHGNLGQPLELEVARAGEVLTLTVIPRTEWPDNQGPMGISMGLAWEMVRHPLPRAMIRAGQEMAFHVREMAMIPVRLITRQLVPGEVRLVSLPGIKAINDEAVEAAVELGALFPVLQVTALVSLSLGLANLLPIPALDGGRILFVLVEAVRGERLAPEREGLVHFVGMMMLLALMMILVVNDLVHPVIPPP